MPFNGSGTFNRVYSWANDKLNTIKITASRVDTEDSGFATGLSTVICKDGQTTTTAQIPFAVGISIAAGTTAAPGCAVIADLTTGMYQSTAGALDFSCSGTRVGGFTSAGLVNTAIGAATPAAGTFTTLSASSTLSAVGTLTVNTNKLIVNGSTGNTTIAGTLGVTGAVAVNTNKFTVNTSGNIATAGSVTITPFATAGVVTNNSSGLFISTTALPSTTTATTQSAGDSSTKVATTAFVQGEKKVYQVVATTVVTSTTGTTVLPNDDTIPQNTEGDQYMAATITPKSATNVLIINTNIHLANGSGSDLAAALFQDSTAGALSCGAHNIGSSAVGQITFTHKMLAGTTSSTTFKVRGGSGTAGTTTFNGSGGGRKYGGVLSSSIVIQEVAP